MSKWNFIHEDLYMEHKNFHIACSQHQMHIVYTSLSYTRVSIQPADKAVEHQLTNLYD